MKHPISRRIFWLLLIVYIAISMIALQKKTDIIIHPPVEEIEPLETHFDEVPVLLKKIAYCESTNRQYDDSGEVLRGYVNSDDVGKWQINLHYHGEVAMNMGIDVFTEEGNREYALFLYDEGKGISHWVHSKPCWSDPNRTWYVRNGDYWSRG